MNDEETAERSGGANRPIEFTLLLLAAVGVFVSLRAATVGIPMDRDEGEYAYSAQRMLAGEALYRDAFNNKPPGVFFVFLVPIALFGTSTPAIRVAMFVFSAATVWATWWAVRLVAGRLAAAFAVLALSYITVDPGLLGTSANTEQFMIFPMTLSLAMALRALRTGGRGAWFAAGAAAMAAVWFKQVAVTNGLFVGVLLLFGRRARRAGAGAAGRVADAAAFLLGVAAAAAPVVTYFVCVGTWDELWDACVTHGVRYSTYVSWGQGWANLREQLFIQSHSLWTLWAFAATALAPGARGRARRLLTGWLAASLAGVAAGLYFRDHYFLQAAPALAAAAGVGMARITRGLTPRRYRASRPAVALAAVLVALAPGLRTYGYFYFALDSRQQCRALFTRSPFDLSEDLADYLARHTAPDDRVLIFGSEPQILFKARRRSATRYIAFYPLTMALEQAEERQAEVWRTIRDDPPRYILMTDLPESLLERADTPDLLRRNVRELLARDYELEGFREFDGRQYVLRLGFEARIAAQAAEAGSGREVPRDLWLFVRRR